MNAIIVAAGLGSRFKEMTKNKHKALLPIAGIPNLERTLQLLQEAGISEVHLVVGYLADSFYYLKEKFPAIVFHENKDYQKFNNISTFQKILPFFGDSFVIDGDTVFVKNIFKQPQKSTYFTMIRKEEGTEWCPITDETGRVVEMKITNEKLPAMSGVTYWTKKDAEKIKQVFPRYSTEEKLLDPKGYWDDIPVALLDQLDVTTKEILPNSLFEMDNQENYRMIENFFMHNNLEGQEF